MEREEFRKVGPSIAIVEDDPHLCQVYSILLKRRGRHVAFISNSGEEIIDAVNDGNFIDGFDTVLMDYQLGKGLNGIDTALELKHRFPKTQIIMITGDRSIEKEAINAGFGFLPKPFSISELTDFIDSKMNDVMLA